MFDRNKMAVWKQLQVLFDEPQVGGAITVERTGSGLETRTRTRTTSQTQQSVKSWKRVPGSPGMRVDDYVLYQCKRCRAVLGDSLNLCAQEERSRLLVCFKVTNDVVVEDNFMICFDGDLIGCTYNTLHCRSCELDLGFKLYSSKSLAYLRGFFCFSMESILCYLLKTKTTIEASKVTCPVVSLKENIQKLKESLVLVHMRVELLIKKLEKLNQQRTTSEKQSYKARPCGQTSGCTKRKLTS